MNYSSSYNYSRGDSPSTSRRMLAESKEAALRANNTCVQSFRKILHSKDPIGCLVSCTKFSGREIKLIYRNFKQVREKAMYSTDYSRASHSILLLPYLSPALLRSVSFTKKELRGCDHPAFLLRVLLQRRR